MLRPVRELAGEPEMSNTPRTESLYAVLTAPYASPVQAITDLFTHACQLERELNAQSSREQTGEAHQQGERTVSDKLTAEHCVILLRAEDSQGNVTRKARDEIADEIEHLRAELAVQSSCERSLVEALSRISLEAAMFRVDPPMTEDELMEKFEVISEIAESALEAYPAKEK